MVLAKDSTVMELLHGLNGFEVTTSGGKNHVFAVHSADVASEWVSAIRATIVRIVAHAISLS